MKSNYMNKKEIEKLAKSILVEHGIYSIPVDPVVLANKLGIKVSNAVFANDSISGMIAKKGSFTSLLVKQSDTPYRKRFTIAHELGHHFLHLQDDGEIVDMQSNMFRITEPGEGEQDDAIREFQANFFAASILMDADLVRSKWREVRSIEAMAKLFNVSEESMGYRINYLGLK